MLKFEALTRDICRLKVPFGSIYTAVFLIRTADGDFLLDTATTETDVKDIILPALREETASPAGVILSHRHHDHAGGLKTLLDVMPALPVYTFDVKLAQEAENGVLLQDGMRIGGYLKVFHLPGHCPDAAAVYDGRSQTLLTGDCLQSFGIGKYGTIVTDSAAYLRSIDCVRKMPVQRLIAAHEYVKNGSTAEGQAQVKRYLDECEQSFLQIDEFVKSRKTLTDDEVMREWSMLYPELPPLYSGTIMNMKKE